MGVTRIGVTIRIRLTVSEDHRDVYDLCQRGRPTAGPGSRATRGYHRAHARARALVHLHLPGFLAGPLVTPTLFSFFRSILPSQNQHSSSRRLQPWTPGHSCLHRNDEFRRRRRSLKSHSHPDCLLALPVLHVELEYPVGLAYQPSPSPLCVTSSRVRPDCCGTSAGARLTFFICSFFCASGIFSNTCARAWRSQWVVHVRDMIARYLSDTAS